MRTSINKSLLLMITAFVSLNVIASVVMPSERVISKQCTNVSWYPEINFQTEPFVQSAVCSYDVQGPDGVRSVSVQIADTRRIMVKIVTEVTMVKNSLISETDKQGVQWCRGFNKDANALKNGRRSDVYEKTVYRYSNGVVLESKESLSKTHYSGACS